MVLYKFIYKTKTSDIGQLYLLAANSNEAAKIFKGIVDSFEDKVVEATFYVNI